MKRIFLISFSCIAMILFGACKTDIDIDLVIRNNSPERIGLIYMIMERNSVFAPDIFYKCLPVFRYTEAYDIFHFYSVTERCYINNNYELQVLVFKQSTLDKYSEEEIIRDNIYDARYVLTEDDLVDNTFTIVYTGESDRDVINLMHLP